MADIPNFGITELLFMGLFFHRSHHWGAPPCINCLGSNGGFVPFGGINGGYPYKIIHL